MKGETEVTKLQIISLILMEILFLICVGLSIYEIITGTIWGLFGLAIIVVPSGQLPIIIYKKINNYKEQ